MAEQLIHTLQFPGLPDTYVIPEVGRNLLQNWYFVGGGSQQGGGQFPINQRALTSYPTGTSYCIDRWKHTTTYTTTQLYSDYLLLSAAGGSSDYGYVEQFISWNAIRGKVVTYSVLYLDSSNRPQLASGSGTTFSTPPAQGANNAVVQINDLIPNGAGCGFYVNSIGQAFVQIGQTPENSIKLVAVKLELGDTQTLAHLENNIWVLNEIPNYEFELLRCKTATVDSSDIYANNLNIADKNYCRNNLLRNWYFVGGGTGLGVFPVNQRNQMVYTTQEYCIDGWELFPYSGGTLTLEASYITFVKNDATQNPGMHQYFDGIQDGNVVTISILSTDGLASVTSEPLSSQIGSSWQVSQQMFNSKIWCGLRFISGHWNMSFTTAGASIIAVKVELGTQQTLAHFENETWILNELPDYEIELLKCQTSATHTDDLYANKIISLNIPNSNFVYNPYFVGGGSQQGDRQFPINSRGLTTYTGDATFTIDRWWMRNTSNTGSPMVNVLSEGVQIVTDGASGQGLNQPIEGFRNLAGKTVTASLLIIQNTFISGSYPYFGLWNSTTLATNNTTVKAIPLAGQGTGLFTFTVTLPQNWTNNYLNIGIYFSTYSGSIKVSAMKLELGTQQTLAHLENGEWVLNEVPDYEEELIKCQTAASDFGQDPYAHNVVSINVSNPNLLHNWYFIGGGTFTNFPINQREQTSYTVAGYGSIDNWNSQRTTHTLTIQSDCIHWERVTNGSYNPLFYQNVKVVQDRVYTYSILYRTTFRKLRETFTATLLPEASDWTLYTKTATVSGTSLAIGVQDISYNQGLDDTGKYIEIKAIKFELGTQQTLAHLENGVWVINEVPDYFDQLYKCLRYVKKINGQINTYPARTDTSNLYFFIPGGAMAQAPSTLTSLQVYFYTGTTYYSLTANCSFVDYYDGVRGTMAKGTIPDNIGGSLVFANTVYLSAES